MRDDRERLLDILEAIDRIEERLPEEQGDFDADDMVQVWAVHHLRIIGEAASKLGKEFKEATPQIPWQEIIGMRNILVHQYFDVDADIVWAACRKDLPTLKKEIAVLLESKE